MLLEIKTLPLHFAFDDFESPSIRHSSRWQSFPRALNALEVAAATATR
jgi:hypothetical protein